MVTKTHNKIGEMFLAAIDKKYGDGLIAQYMELPDCNFGATLAQFIVREIRDVTKGCKDSNEAAGEVFRAMGKSINQLMDCMHAVKEAEEVFQRAGKLARKPFVQHQLAAPVKIPTRPPLPIPTTPIASIIQKFPAAPQPCPRTVMVDTRNKCLRMRTPSPQAKVAVPAYIRNAFKQANQRGWYWGDIGALMGRDSKFPHRVVGTTTSKATKQVGVSELSALDLAAAVVLQWNPPVKHEEEERVSGVFLQQELIALRDDPERMKRLIKLSGRSSGSVRAAVSNMINTNSDNGLIRKVAVMLVAKDSAIAALVKECLP